MHISDSQNLGNFVNRVINSLCIMRGQLFRKMKENAAFINMGERQVMWADIILNTNLTDKNLQEKLSVCFNVTIYNAAIIHEIEEIIFSGNNKITCHRQSIEGNVNTMLTFYFDNFEFNEELFQRSFSKELNENLYITTESPDIYEFIEILPSGSSNIVYIDAGELDSNEKLIFLLN